MAKLAPIRVLLQTERLELRLLNSDDALAISKIMTPGISKWLANWPPHISEQDVRQKISKYQKHTEEKKALTVAIYRRADTRFIGSLSIGVRSDAPEVGVIGYWIGEAYQGKGYLGEIIHDFVDHAFITLGITTLEAGAQMENHASFAMMRKMGMQPVGKKSLYVPSRDREEDVLFFSMTRQTARP